MVVTYRGDAPNIYYHPFTDASLDIDNDGVMDYRFIGDPFVAAVMGHGTNRFISVLATGSDQGNYLSPVAAGSVIGPDTSALSGDWHHDTDNVSNPALSTGSGLNLIQSVNTYIGVEFQAADGIHYGWISYVGFSTPNYFPIYDMDGNIIGYSEGGPEFPGGFINSWAWETTPGKPIAAGVVPEPGSVLLCLSAGAFGLLRRRRDP